jgi:hypothetical protein
MATTTTIDPTDTARAPGSALRARERAAAIPAPNPL